MLPAAFASKMPGIIKLSWNSNYLKKIWNEKQLIQELHFTSSFRMHEMFDSEEVETIKCTFFGNSGGIQERSAP